MLLQRIFLLIVETLASVVGGLLLLRFWMQAIRIRPPNTIGHFTFALTDWLVRPLRRIIPGLGGYDWASLLAAFLFAILTFVARILFMSLTIELVLLASLLRLVDWAIYSFMFYILIEVALSWVNPHAPLAPFIQALNYPLLRPLRRIIPLAGGFDLSPLFALLLLRIGLEVVMWLKAEFGLVPLFL